VFSAGNKVDMTGILGPTIRGDYTMDGRKVVVTLGGASVVFSIDDKGCLDDGIAKYCRK
jgi:hypothetical protein